MPPALTHPLARPSALTSDVERGVGVARRSTSMLPRRPILTSGDVVVSRPTASADRYSVGVVNAAACTGETRYEDALETGRRLARALAVDGWFTCDQTHYLRIATHRR